MYTSLPGSGHGKQSQLGPPALTHCTVFVHNPPHTGAAVVVVVVVVVPGASVVVVVVVVETQTFKLLDKINTFPPLAPTGPFDPDGSGEYEAVGILSTTNDAVAAKLEVTEISANLPKG